ncbi:MAG: O-methyltransferase [Chitinophagales bacterium]|nr:O-methyltransferase [Chitinophagales bacterium]MCZ2394581.1 O-methyltransferase [Chitinophagales bacterium]
MSELLSNEIEDYIHIHCSEVSSVLQRLERKTYTDVLMPRMLSGKVQGTFLSIISRMMQPKRILEIGTFTGYSALCLAEGLSNDGLLVTIDINEEREDIIQEAIQEAGLKKKIQTFTGNALHLIPQIDEIFDIVFIDADKINYCNYFDLVIDKVRTGGIILADNVLWSGKVISEKRDKDTEALKEFNKKVQEDSRVDNVILSIRDGITLIYKK